MRFNSKVKSKFLILKKLLKLKFLKRMLRIFKIAIRKNLKLKVSSKFKWILFVLKNESLTFKWGDFKLIEILMIKKNILLLLVCI